MRVGPSGKQFDDEWGEIPDPTPISVPVQLKPRSIQDMVAMYVGQAMALQRRMDGEEEAFEAEDLAVDDGEDGDEILTPYELHALAAEAEQESRRKAWLLDQIRGKKKDAKPKEDGAAGVPASSAGAAAAPVASPVVDVPPPTPAPPSGGSGGGVS